MGGLPLQIMNEEEGLIVQKGDIESVAAALFHLKKYKKNKEKKIIEYSNVVQCGCWLVIFLHNGRIDCSSPLSFLNK